MTFINYEELGMTDINRKIEFTEHVLANARSWIKDESVNVKIIDQIATDLEDLKKESKDAS